MNRSYEVDYQGHDGRVEAAIVERKVLSVADVKLHSFQTRALPSERELFC